MKTIFGILFSAILGTVSCDSGKHDSLSATSRTELDSASTPPRMTIAGLNLELSGKPQKAELAVGEVDPDIISQTDYLLQDGSTQLGIFRSIHTTTNGLLQANARSVVEGHKTYSIVDGFVDGLPAKRIWLMMNIENQVQHISMIVFVKGNSLWKVVMVDPKMTAVSAKMDRLIPTIKVVE